MLPTPDCKGRAESRRREIILGVLKTQLEFKLRELRQKGAVAILKTLANLKDSYYTKDEVQRLLDRYIQRVFKPVITRTNAVLSDIRCCTYVEHLVFPPVVQGVSNHVDGCNDGDSDGCDKGGGGDREHAAIKEKTARMKVKRQDTLNTQRRERERKHGVGGKGCVVRNVRSHHVFHRMTCVVVRHALGL